MKIEATGDACEVIERAKGDRSGALVITIGTGCCESTAPFLYDDFWPGPDHEEVGRAAGVPIVAPEYLRDLYPGDDALILDVDREYLGESLSIETEYSCRFTLRREGQERSGGEACIPAEPRTVVGELPEALRRLKFR